VRHGGHDDVESHPARQICGDACRHERAELRCERALATVFEAMDRAAKRATVGPRGVDTPAALGLAGIVAVEAQPRAGRLAAGAAWCEKQI